MRVGVQRTAIFVWLAAGVALFLALPSLVAMAQRNQASLVLMRAVLAPPPTGETTGAARIPAQAAARAPYLAGVEAAQRGDHAQAAALFAQAQSHQPLSHWRWLQETAAAGDWRAALQAADLSRLEERTLFAELMAHHEADLSAAERERYQAELRTSPDMVVIYARELLWQRRFAEVVAWIDSIDAAQQTPAASFYAGRGHYYLRQWPEAERIFRALDAEGFGPQAAYWLGRALFDQGRSAEGLSEVRRAVESLPEESQPEILAVYAEMMAQAGQCSEAGALVQAALANPRMQAAQAILQDGLARVEKRCP